MARKIVDCKDTTTGELVYPKTHGDAVLLSDGRSVATAIEQAEAAQEFFLTEEEADGKYQPLNAGGGEDNVAYPLESHTEATLEITPNVMHVWGEMAALTVTLGEEVEGIANEYIFQFTSGATATTLTMPSGLVWDEGLSDVSSNVLIPTANSTYQVSIVDNKGVYVKFPA